MPQFYGIMDGSGDNRGVRIPDLPGCHGGGGTPGEALADAISAARERAEHRACVDGPLDARGAGENF